MKNKKAIATIYVIIFIVLLIIFVGYAFWNNYQRTHKINLLNYIVKVNPPTTTNPTNPTNPTNSAVNIQITSTTYPNINLTPGHILTMDASFLCIPGTPERLSVNTPESTMKQLFANYHLTYPTTKQYQIDRFIPTSLGGSNNIKNLWPQGATPFPGYKEKDKVENYLYTLMCNETINISTAQQMIKIDWVKVYQECCTK